MSESYLWDKSGDPDPDVDRIEHALAPLRYRGGAPDLDAMVAAATSANAQSAIAPSVRKLFLSGLAIVAAASLLLVVAVRLLFAPPPPALQPVTDDGARWAVEALAGTPKIGDAKLHASGALAVGEWLETGTGERARIQVADIGRVDIEEDSRVRLVATGKTQHRLQLARGRIDALVSAPPRLFIVDTPAATAVDLGCRYTLDVDESGEGELQVTLGWVALEHGGAVAFVPRGARCRIFAGGGVGLPRFTDCDAAIETAATTIEEMGAAALAADALKAALDATKERDSLTLWHVLLRATPEQRPVVFDRLADLAPPPATVTRDGVLALDAAMLETWRADLEISWW